MSKNDWIYSQDGRVMNPDYKAATPAERQILEALSDTLLDVTYARGGQKAEARRKAALDILYVVKAAYKLHKDSDLLLKAQKPSAGYMEAHPDPTKVKKEDI